MTRYRGGPPRDDAARTASPNCPGTCVKGLSQTHTRQPRAITAHRPIGRYAAGWTAGFTAGAVDALRLAAREIDDPHVWLALSRVAYRYSDDYKLCGAGDQ